jgi:hypothetical protein
VARDPVKWSRRRNAVRRAANRQGRVNTPARLGALCLEDFRATARNGLPFIMEGIVSRWPLAAMTVAELGEKFSATLIRVRRGDYVRTAFSRHRTLVDMRLDEYLTLAGSDANQLPPYAGNVFLPELERLCYWPPYFVNYQLPKVWFGPAGTVTPLHCDYFDNLYAQVWGRKKIRLFHPCDGELLPTREINPTLYASLFDPEEPDYARWPSVRDACEIECIVGAGDLLFLPAGWFHHVRAVDFSLSVSRWTEDYPIAAD